MKLFPAVLIILAAFCADKVSGQSTADSVSAKVLSELETPLPLSILAAGVEYPVLSLNSSEVTPGLPFSVELLDLTMPNDDFKKWLQMGVGVRQKQEHYSLFVPEHHPWREVLVEAGMPERGNHEAVVNSRSMGWWLLLGCLSDDALEKVLAVEMHFHPPAINEFARRDQLPAARKMILEMTQRARKVKTLSWIVEREASDREYDFARQRFDWKDRPVPLSYSLAGGGAYFVSNASGKGVSIGGISVPEAEARKMFAKGGSVKLELEIHAAVKGIAVFSTPKLWIEVEKATLHHRPLNLSFPVQAEDYHIDFEYKRLIPPKLIRSALPKSD